MNARSVTSRLVLMLVLLSSVAAVRPLSAQPRTERYIYVNSYCEHPLQLIVYHKDNATSHHTHGWYSFRPYQENRLEANGVTLKQVVGADLYIYAETVAQAGVPSLTWGGKDATAMFDGVNYSMRRVDLSVNDRGDLEFRLTCRS